MTSPLNKLTEGMRRVEVISNILREKDSSSSLSNESNSKDMEKENIKKEKGAIRELLGIIIDPKDEGIKSVAESTLISHTTGLDKNFTELICLHEKLVGEGIELDDIVNSMQSYSLQQLVKKSLYVSSSSTQALGHTGF